jgi:hypothetical protein
MQCSPQNTIIVACRLLSLGAYFNPLRHIAAVLLIIGCLTFLVIPGMAADRAKGLGLAQNATAIFEPGEIIVYWTAPGDDSLSGRASGYDLRYSPYASGPIDTDEEWESATQVGDEPLPGLPSQIDSAVVRGLEYGGNYYFCLKVFDEALNFSGISNSPFLAAGDTTGYNYLPGDANGNGHLSGIDVVFLVAYLKGIGTPPLPYLTGDSNGDCAVNGLDVVYLVNYFKGWGAAPIRGDCNR